MCPCLTRAASCNHSSDSVSLQSHPVSSSAKLIVILTLTLLVITEKDSAPLNDELGV